jgi:hypothetical protein
MPTPQQLQQQLDQINDQFDLLENKLNNIGSLLSDKLAGKVSDLKNEARDFVDKFEKGENVTKQLNTKLLSVQKDLDKLGLKRLNLEKALIVAQTNGNIRAEQSIKIAINENNLATSMIEKLQSQLLELRRINEEEVKRKEELKQQQKLENSIYTQIKKRYELLKNALSGMFTYLITAFKVVDQGSTDMAKSMGITKEAAVEMSNGFEKYVRNSKDGFLSLQKMQKAQTELTQQLGFAAKFSEDELETFARLTGIVGLTADEAGKLAQFSAAAGMSSTKYVADIRRSAFFAQQANKVHISDKELLQSISKLSSGILVKFQNNPKALAEAVIQAKKLGLNLEQVDKIGESMLNWESSIENELEAELITGKKLNFERARAAALTGDQATLMQEVANQAGSLAEFQNMNVIAQSSLAKAFGMSKDEMAEMLMKQEAINNYGDKAAQLNAEQLDYMKRHNLTADQMLDKVNNQRSAQEKFNDGMERLQGIVGNLVAGPFGQLADLMGKILSSTTGLVAIMSIYIARQVFSLALTIADFQAKRRAAKMNAVDASIEIAKSAAKAPIIGAAIAGVAALAAFGIFSGLLSKGDDVVSQGYGKRMLLDKGTITAFNDNDTIVAGTNLGGNRRDSNSGVIAAIGNLATAVASKPTPTPQFALNVDGQRLGSVVGRQSETGTQQSQNAYRLA